VPDLAFEELDGHGLVAELGFEVVDEGVASVGLAALERGLSSGEEVVSPFGDACGGDAELA
jgi:hypothetical protein